MSLFRKDIDCMSCEYSGPSTWGFLGIVLWVLTIILFLFSWIFWPLFLLWPILLIFLIVYPLGHVCPECGTRHISRRHR